MMDITKITKTEYDVKSDNPKTPNQVYKVLLDKKPSCSCPSFIHRKEGKLCKHIMEVMKLTKSNMIDADEPEPENVLPFDSNGNDNDEAKSLPEPKKAFKLKPEHIIDYKGKDFILYKGLLEAGQHIGIQSLDASEILQFPNEENQLLCIVKAVLISKDGERYSEIGDASPIISYKYTNKYKKEIEIWNMKDTIRPHWVRMAATRAKARVLRDFTGITTTCFEELGVDDEDENGGDIKKSNNNGYKKELVDAKTPLLKRDIIKYLIKLDLITTCSCKTPEECDHSKKIEFDKLEGFSLDRLQDIVIMFQDEEIKTKKIYDMILKD